MVVGHYAAALAVKAAEPRSPLWVYVIAAQLIDIAWAALVILGIERMRIDATMPGSSLDLYHMPWTHSLPAALVWSALAGIFAVSALRLPRRAACFVALTVFSHWVGDLLVHRPDLALWPGGTKLGFALWNLPVIEQAVEMGMLAIAAAAWVGREASKGHRRFPAVLFVAWLVCLQLLTLILPLSTEPGTVGTNALAAFGLTTTFAAAAGWRRSSPRSLAKHCGEHQTGAEAR